MLTGLFVLLLVVALPLLIVVLVVRATESERASVSPDLRARSMGRAQVGLVFGLAALPAVAVLIRPGDGYFVLLWVPGLAAFVVATGLAGLLHRWLTGPSAVAAMLTGLAVALGTVMALTGLIGLLIAPSLAGAWFALSAGAALVLAPPGTLVLLIGSLAGWGVNRWSKRPAPRARSGSIQQR